MSARWNDETQSWETVGGKQAPGPSPIPPPAPPAAPVAAPGAGPVVPPPPPPPSYAPQDVPAPSHAPAYVPETGEWQYPTAPAPAGGGRARARGAVAAGAAVAVLAAGSVGAWLVWGADDGGKNGAGGGPAVSVSAPVETPSDYPTDSPTEDPTDPPTADPTDTASPSGSASTTMQPTDDLPPPAYSVQKDLKGFMIAVPEGWDRTESDQGIFYNAPDGKSLLQVFVITEPDLTPYEALRGASDDGKANKPGYVEIGLDRVTGEPGAPADSAELVYAYDREGGRRKVVDRAFTAADGNHYAILSAGPEADWPKQREVLRVALEFFRPGAH
ncbi:serine/arginine repetitive matrix protein 2 [Streptomyces sp. NPDC059593]|uniref:serine/arginine repetitive matrix protein 2 n=1 Tax=Streptomyces sp. NPDC059593 TaxID=3346878 RepID=UPI00369922D7